MFTPGSGSGISSTTYTPYAYPKHVAMFNGELIVMSRNDSTIHRYDPVSLAHLGSFSVGSGSGQGVATDGELLYASLWTGSSVTIKVFDGAYSPVTSYAKPSGMSENNLIDMAYEQHTGTWFGIVTNGEHGTSTSSSTVIEFTMGAPSPPPMLFRGVS